MTKAKDPMVYVYNLMGTRSGDFIVHTGKLRLSKFTVLAKMDEEEYEQYLDDKDLSQAFFGICPDTIPIILKKLKRGKSYADWEDELIIGVALTKQEARDAARDMFFAAMIDGEETW